MTTPTEVILDAVVEHIVELDGSDTQSLYLAYHSGEPCRVYDVSYDSSTGGYIQKFAYASNRCNTQLTIPKPTPPLKEGDKIRVTVQRL